MVNRQKPSITQVSWVYTWNDGTAWFGNKMENLARGMLLNINGVIGTQGSSTFGIGNFWNGSWLGTNYNIYTDQSYASLSPLYIGSMTLNLWGDPDPISYFSFPPNPLSSSASVYNCFAPTARTATATIPNVLNYSDNESFYIAVMPLYRFLHLNDSVKNLSPSLMNFYNNLSGSSLESFMFVEEALTIGDFLTASSLVSAVTATNAVEANYISFYNLYINYASHSFEHSNNSDSTNLNNLAAMCPGIDGGCVYQARNLFNAVYGKTDFWQGCFYGASKLGSSNSLSKKQQPNQLQLYPNPASNSINIESLIENEKLKVEIRDLTGRLVYIKNIQLNGFIANLDLSLINGAYLIIISRNNNEQVRKKLVIAK